MSGIGGDRLTSEQSQAAGPAFTVRRIRTDEVDEAKALRLSALAGAPDAFAEDYASSAGQPASFWEERTRNGAESAGLATFVAVLGGRHVGTATGVCFDAGAPAELVAMWVEPKARRHGAGRALVDRVCRWAAERGAASIELDVRVGNRLAQRLYEAAGFVVARGPEPSPDDPSAIEVRMRRALG